MATIHYLCKREHGVLRAFSYHAPRFTISNDGHLVTGQPPTIYITRERKPKCVPLSQFGQHRKQSLVYGQGFGFRNVVGMNKKHSQAILRKYGFELALPQVRWVLAQQMEQRVMRMVVSGSSTASPIKYGITVQHPPHCGSR